MDDRSCASLFSTMLLRQRGTNDLFRSACTALEQLLQRCCHSMEQMPSAASVSHHCSDSLSEAADNPLGLRQSSRRLEQQRKMQHMKAVLDGSHGLVQMSYCPIKGRSVTACQQFSSGDWVLEYCGELVDSEVAQRREERYGMDVRIGCFMFYFKFNEKLFCIDATEESLHLGRIVNHSAKEPNLVPRLIVIHGKPRIFFFARKFINIGDELLYDYGDRSLAALDAHPWLKSS